MLNRWSRLILWVAGAGTALLAAILVLRREQQAPELPEQREPALEPRPSQPSAPAAVQPTAAGETRRAAEATATEATATEVTATESERAAEAPPSATGATGSGASSATVPDAAATATAPNGATASRPSVDEIVEAMASGRVTAETVRGHLGREVDIETRSRGPERGRIREEGDGRFSFTLSARPGGVTETRTLDLEDLVGISDVPG